MSNTGQSAQEWPDISSQMPIYIFRHEEDALNRDRELAKEYNGVAKISLGIRKDEPKFEEQEMHLLNAVRRDGGQSGSLIPTPMIARIPNYFEIGYVCGPDYYVHVTDRILQNVPYALDDDDFRFLECLERREPHAVFWQHRMGFEGVPAAERAPSEDLLEWVLFLLDVCFPARFRISRLLPGDVMHAYNTLSVVLADQLRNDSLRFRVPLLPVSVLAAALRLPDDQLWACRNNVAMPPPPRAPPDASRRPPKKAPIVIDDMMSPRSATGPDSSAGAGAGPPDALNASSLVTETTGAAGDDAQVAQKIRRIQLPDLMTLAVFDAVFHYWFYKHALNKDQPITPYLRELNSKKIGCPFKTVTAAQKINKAKIKNYKNIVLNFLKLAEFILLRETLHARRFDGKYSAIAESNLRDDLRTLTRASSYIGQAPAGRALLLDTHEASTSQALCVQEHDTQATLDTTTQASSAPPTPRRHLAGAGAGAGAGTGTGTGGSASAKLTPEEVHLVLHHVVFKAAVFSETLANELSPERPVNAENFVPLAPPEQTLAMLPPFTRADLKEAQKLLEKYERPYDPLAPVPAHQPALLPFPFSEEPGTKKLLKPLERLADFVALAPESQDSGSCSTPDTAVPGTFLEVCRVFLRSYADSQAGASAQSCD